LVRIVLSKQSASVRRRLPLWAHVPCSARLSSFLFNEINGPERSRWRGCHFSVSTEVKHCRGQNLRINARPQPDRNNVSLQKYQADLRVDKCRSASRPTALSPSNVTFPFFALCMSLLATCFRVSWSPPWATSSKSSSSTPSRFEVPRPSTFTIRYLP
jgi:hypothetical protein